MRFFQLRPCRSLARAYHSPSHDRFKILFCGRDEFSCTVFSELHRAQDVWQDLHVVTNPDELIGRHKKFLSVSPLKMLAQSLTIPVHEIPRVKSDFRQWKPPSPFAEVQEGPPLEHLLVTASFGRIIPKAFLSLFQPERRVNVHPSLLPAYRGAAPIQRAMMDGVSLTGVSIIQMLERSKGIDAGPIFDQCKMDVVADTSFPVLRDHLARQGGQLLVKVLRSMMQGTASLTSQLDATDAPRANMIRVEDSYISFPTMSARDIVRRDRAISHQRPLTSCTTNGKTLQLHSPTLVTHLPPGFCLGEKPGSASYCAPTRTLFVRCADGSVISVEKLKQEGKSLLSAKDWWNGARSLNLVQENQVQLVDVK